MRKAKDYSIFEHIDVPLLKRFKIHHDTNPEIWMEFKRMAFQMISVRNKYSHVSMIEVIRWNRNLVSSGEPFKVNNDYKALYARLMIYHFPQFEGFFELRRMKPEDRRDSNEEIYRSEDGNKL